eukprot:m.103919 g.103919  ORF g.103919 m.103919 type:complete len:879 (+) comp14158_c0_seq15:830-3466(+)
MEMIGESSMKLTLHFDGEMEAKDLCGFHAVCTRVELNFEFGCARLQLGQDHHTVRARNSLECLLGIAQEKRLKEYARGLIAHDQVAAMKNPSAISRHFLEVFVSVCLVVVAAPCGLTCHLLPTFMKRAYFFTGREKAAAIPGAALEALIMVCVFGGENTNVRYCIYQFNLFILGSDRSSRAFRFKMATLDSTVPETDALPIPCEPEMLALDPFLKFAMKQDHVETKLALEPLAPLPKLDDTAKLFALPQVELPRFEEVKLDLSFLHKSPGLFQATSSAAPLPVVEEVLSAKAQLVEEKAQEPNGETLVAAVDAPVVAEPEEAAVPEIAQPRREPEQQLNAATLSDEAAVPMSVDVEPETVKQEVLPSTLALNNVPQAELTHMQIDQADMLVPESTLKVEVSEMRPPASPVAGVLCASESLIEAPVVDEQSTAVQMDADADRALPEPPLVAVAEQENPQQPSTSSSSLEVPLVVATDSTAVFAPTASLTQEPIEEPRQPISAEKEETDLPQAVPVEYERTPSPVPVAHPVEPTAAGAEVPHAAEAVALKENQESASPLSNITQEKEEEAEEIIVVIPEPDQDFEHTVAAVDAAEEAVPESSHLELNPPQTLENAAPEAAESEEEDPTLDELHAQGMWSEETKRLNATQRNVSLTPSIAPDLSFLFPQAAQSDLEGKESDLPSTFTQHTPTAMPVLMPVVVPTPVHLADSQDRVIETSLVSPLQEPTVSHRELHFSVITCHRTSATAVVSSHDSDDHEGEVECEADDNDDIFEVEQAPEEDEDMADDEEYVPAMVPDPYSPPREEPFVIRRRSLRLSNATPPAPLFVARDHDLNYLEDGMRRQPPITIPVTRAFPVTRMRFGLSRKARVAPLHPYKRSRK